MKSLSMLPSVHAVPSPVTMNFTLFTVAEPVPALIPTVVCISVWSLVPLMIPVVGEPAASVIEGAGGNTSCRVAPYTAAAGKVKDPPPGSVVFGVRVGMNPTRSVSATPLAATFNIT
ncbi:MAG: hypothetical protein IPG63_18005 [Xanthomonadales bacterium]|nr:hypothetical protein [Xanthomonadales bacterium]